MAAVPDQVVQPDVPGVGGRRVPRQADLYEIDNVLEKPTPSEAEQRLLVPGLRAGYYLCFFGMHVLTPANLPSTPSFPNRLLFAGGGFAGGLIIWFGLAMWLEFRDESLRTEADVVALLDLPVLTQVPWVTTESPDSNANGKSRKHGKKETVEV